MKRRGTFTVAGPVKITRPNADGEPITAVLPPYSPRAYWQVIKEQEREAERAKLSHHHTKKAAAARMKLGAKIAAGEAALQQVRDRRSSGSRQG